tara:strand:+ start:1953 stop:2252 length:300 start_codon:yes stop_codon:yes gene_type:complete
MQELEKKIKDLKEFIKEKTDQGTANYLGKEIREICGMVESEQFSLHGVGSTLTDKEKIDYTLHAKKKMSEDNAKGWLAALIYTMVLFIVGYNLLKWLSS